MEVYFFPRLEELMRIAIVSESDCEIIYSEEH
jgi:hypothetical protein